MKNTTTFRVVMLPTHGTTKSNIILVEGELRLLTNYYEDICGQHLYILSDNEIKGGDWCLGGDRIFHNTVQLDAYINIYKIISSTDKSIAPNSWIPESFVNAYVKSFNDVKQITEVDLEWDERGIDTYSKIGTRPDGSVIIHQSKMYSIAQVVRAMDVAHQEGLLYGQNPKYKSKMQDYYKWIEENL